jgi:AraC-like DNA-binding protein
VGSQVFTAAEVPARSRAEYWRHVLGEALVPLDPYGEPDRVTSGELGPVVVGELQHRGAGGAKRTAAHIRRSDPGMVKIDVLSRGRGVVEQGGSEARLRPGDLTLVDLSRPSGWAMSSPRCVSVMFPRSLLPLGADALARLSAVRLPGTDAAAAPISSLARQLPARVGAEPPSLGARMGAAVVDLLSVALAGLLDRPERVPPETRQRALLHSVHAFIELHLGDPELSPATIAGSQFISVRYLHRLFEPEETTVADWIRRRRLERCARDLLDPAHRTEPVGSIGARWGITSPAHFSRR